MTWSSLKASLQGEEQSDSLDNLILSFSLMSRSSFLDSSASFKLVIKGKLIVSMKTHIELNQLVMFLKTSPALNIKKFVH